MALAWAVAALLAGLCLGGMLNLVIGLFPAGASGRSPFRCRHCGSRLGPLDLLPLATFLLVRGHRRCCGRRIRTRQPLIEAVTGLSMAALYWQYGATPQMLALAFLFCLFLAIAVIDLDWKLIPNMLVYPACPIALLIGSFFPVGMAAASQTPLHGLAFSLLGGVLAFVFLLVPALVRADSMGWGDIKFAGLIGLATGFPGILAALALASVGGGLTAIGLIASGAKTRRGSMPFGPFLSAGALAALLWGNQISKWYLGLAW